MGKTILIALVVAIVVGGAAAYGGYKMGDTAGFQRANLVRQQFAQQRQAQSGQTQQGSGFGGAGRGIQGTIKSVNGDTVTVTIGQRDVTVKLSDKTQIEKAASGSRTDLAAGARVTITPEGSAASSGGNGGGSAGGSSDSISAAAILVLAAQ
jgi:type II secretory pathway pseudopilin PulG